jgi:hypothetical protein
VPYAKATTFADPADIMAFRRAKARGLSDEEAAAVGDNGVGLWGADTTSTTVSMCALPRDVWMAKWGRAANAHGKLVTVTYKGITATGELQDTMPATGKIHNRAGIDLNPGFCIALHVAEGGSYDPVFWDWAE